MVNPMVNMDPSGKLWEAVFLSFLCPLAPFQRQIATRRDSTSARCADLRLNLWGFSNLISEYRRVRGPRGTHFFKPGGPGPSLGPVLLGLESS